MALKQTPRLLQTILLLATFTACGPSFAATLTCSYSQTDQKNQGTGMGGTGNTPGGTGMGGTGRSADDPGIGGTGALANGTGMGGTGAPLDTSRIAGIVLDNKGTAVATLNGKSRVLSKNSAICIGETLVTAPSGTLKIRMSDEGLIELHAASKLRIDKFILGKGSSKASQFALLDGSSRFVTGRIGKEYPQNVLVQTPNATIGVHGTDHIVTVIPNSNADYRAGTYDLVNSGVTFLKTETGVIDIHPHEIGFAASRDEPPSLLHDIPMFYQEERSSFHPDGRPHVPHPEKPEILHPDDHHPGGLEHDHEYESPAHNLPSIMDHHEVVELPELPERPEAPELPQLPHEVED